MTEMSENFNEILKEGCMPMRLKKVLYIAVGAPNSGKTTFINARMDALGGVYVSRDDIRVSLMESDDDYLKHEGETFIKFCEQIQDALDNPHGPDDVYADATHLNKRSRYKLLKKLHLQNVEKIVILWFNVPYELLEERNSARAGKMPIPFSALENMYDSMDTPTTDENPLFEIWEVDGYGYVKPAA